MPEKERAPKSRPKKERAKKGEKKDGQHRSVQAVGRRQAGDLGVAHGDGDGDGGNDQARQQILPEIAPLITGQGFEQNIHGGKDSFRNKKNGTALPSHSF